jgi:hypothetical protein
VEQCAELLSLYDDKNRHAGAVTAIAARHLAEIDAKIADLRRMRATLLMACSAGDHRSECPILDGIARRGR